MQGCVSHRFAPYKFLTTTIHTNYPLLSAGRRQALEEQRQADAEAAAEAERARERQQEAFALMLKKAAREGHTAGGC